MGFLLTGATLLHLHLGCGAQRGQVPYGGSHALATHRKPDSTFWRRTQFHFT